MEYLEIGHLYGGIYPRIYMDKPASDKKRGRRALRDTPLLIQMNRLGLEGLLCDGSQLVEGLDVLVSHLSQDLAVELDTGNLQACLLYTSRCV